MRPRERFDRLLGRHHWVQQDRGEGARAIRGHSQRISPNAETRMVASIPDEKRAELMVSDPALVESGGGEVSQ